MTRGLPRALGEQRSPGSGVINRSPLPGDRSYPLRHVRRPPPGGVQKVFLTQGIRTTTLPGVPEEATHGKRQVDPYG